MKPVAALIALLTMAALLAGCGADGAPEPPKDAALAGIGRVA